MDICDIILGEQKQENTDKRSWYSVYRAFRRTSITFNLQIHKVFVNTYLFIIIPTCFGTQVSSSGSYSYSEFTCQLNVTPTTCINDYIQLACNFRTRTVPWRYL